MAYTELVWARDLLAGASTARGRPGSRILANARGVGRPRIPACLVQQRLLSMLICNVLDAVVINRWIRANMNWNLVSNGGMAIAALALADVPRYAAAAEHALYATPCYQQHLSSISCVSVCLCLGGDANLKYIAADAAPYRQKDSLTPYKTMAQRMTVRGQKARTTGRTLLNT